MASHNKIVISIILIVVLLAATVTAYILTRKQETSNLMEERETVRWVYCGVIISPDGDVIR